MEMKWLVTLDNFVQIYLLNLLCFLLVNMEIYSDIKMQFMLCLKKMISANTVPSHERLTLACVSPRITKNH